MNKQRFRELVKRLHPDTSGDGRTIAAYRLVVSVWHNRKSRFHKCFCGRTILKINKHCLMHRHVKISGAITAVLLCLSLSIGGEFKIPKPPMPPMKKKVRALHSPKGQELYLATPMAIVPKPRLFALTWTSPPPQLNLEFIIEMRPDFNSPWQVLGVTNQPPFPINTTAPRMMYRVGGRWLFRRTLNTLNP